MDDKSEKKGFGKRISDSFKGGTKPKFLGGKSEGGDTPSGLKTDDKRAGAAAGLQSAESNTASQNLEQSEDSLSGAREIEEQAEGFYSGSGKNEAKPDGKKGIKGFLSKKIPILLILGGVMGAGGIMGGAQMFQPFSLVAQFTESFNSMHTSANMRSNAFFNMQMGKRTIKNPIRAKLFSPDTFKISSKQATKLKAQGIEYDDAYKYDGDTKTARVLKFTDENGDIKIITADTKVAAAIGDNAVDFKTYYKDNPDFFNKYNAGSMTWRGAIANWFGTLTELFFKNNKLTRNMFEGFQKKVAENGGDSKVATQEILTQRTDEVGGGGYASRQGIEEADGEDEDGNKVYRNSDTEDVVPDNANTEYKQSDEPVKTSDSKTSRKSLDVGAKLGEISSNVQKGANIACTVGNVIGAVSLLVTAAEALQIINLTTAYFETVDKVKAGDGDDAPIHDLTNALNQSQTSKNATLEYTDYNGNRESEDNITKDGIKALKTEYKTSENKTAMQAQGISALYGGGAVNPNDPSVASFNFTSSIKRILGGIGVSMAGFETCAVAKMVTNGISATIDAVSIVSCIAGAIGAVFTFGATAAAGCGPLIADTLTGIALSVAIGVTVSAVIATITPMVANMLTRDLVSNLGGEDLGNALTSGGNMYLGNAHRANGGSLSTISKYEEYALLQQQVIAENAKYERSTLSPFDMTSKYTFMGTLLTQMMGFLTTNSFMSTITTGGNVVSSSIVALSPTASAYDIEKDLPDMESYNDTCPYLASIGAIGDAYCNPYSITDVSTIGMDPSDVISVLDAHNNFLDGETSDGNVKINGKSDLAKYILYCDNRESAFGIADNNIINSVSDWGNVNTENSTFNTVANSAIGAVPVLGDIIDIGSNAQALANVGYVSGESCVAGNNAASAESAIDKNGENWSDSGSPTWDTAKYYQRFIEDQALAESMGLVEKSAVAVFLDDYYEQNPLDNSYEGILARKSGLDKDTVVAILELVEYGNYIANYHPEERYAFGAPAVKQDGELRFDNEYQLSSAPILLNQIAYADVRNRSFAV